MHSAAVLGARGECRQMRAVHLGHGLLHGGPLAALIGGQPVKIADVTDRAYLVRGGTDALIQHAAARVGGKIEVRVTDPNRGRPGRSGTGGFLGARIAGAGGSGGRDE